MHKVLAAQSTAKELWLAALLLPPMRAEIMEMEGVPVDMQRLIFGGGPMEDRPTLADYNIQSDAEVHLVLKLQGD